MIPFAGRIVGLTLCGAAFVLALLTAPSPTLAAQDVVPPPPKTWPKPVEDRPIIGYLLVDQLEYQRDPGSGTLRWEVQGWLGGDYNKLRVKTEGDQGLSGDNGG
jgi:copper resistance protein B